MFGLNSIMHSMGYTMRGTNCWDNIVVNSDLVGYWQFAQFVIKQMLIDLCRFIR